MIRLLWKLLIMLDDNWGYDTPIQMRFQRGEFAFISNFKTQDTKFEIGSRVRIVDTARYDYLIECDNKYAIVYQFELK